jgi:hypothetical protein
LLEGMSPQQSGHCDERCPMRASGSPTVQNSRHLHKTQAIDVVGLF